MRTILNRPIIIRQVELGGPFGLVRGDMMLDTGADLTVISLDMARILGFDPPFKQHRDLIAAGGVIAVPIIRLDSISVGDARATDVPACIHDLPAEAALEGLLGLSFLRHFRTVIDYRSGVLEIT